jgi:hypothetical protein
MQSAKKSTRILSALSMAAAAGMYASAAHASPTLSLYYGQETSYGNSNNAVMIGSGYNALSPNFDTEGAHEALSGQTLESINASGPTTITIPAGQYLSLAVDAVLTGNANSNSNGSSAGVKDGSVSQPSYLGLSELGMYISSSDAAASLLTPIASPNDTAGTPDTTVSTIKAYTSTALVNNGAIGPNGGAYNVIPAWTGTKGAGNVAPNEPGYSGTANQGGVGFFQNGVPGGDTNIVGFIVGGNTQGDGTSKSDVQAIEQFAAQNNVGSYSNSTDFFDNLVFQALKAGTVTLAPFLVSQATEYWTNTSAVPSSTSVATAYAPSNGFAGGTINNLPVLVIDITPGVSSGPTGVPIISYGSTTPGAAYGSQVASLTVTGHNGSYAVASEAISPASSDGYVAFAGFSPATDEEIFALDVLVNGTQATSSELATLVTAINAGDSSVTASTGVVASTSSPAPDPFGAQYNLFLDPQGNSAGFLGLDLLGSNDSSLAGYSVSAVAVVPEPMTLGLLALGGVGLMARRRNRKA